VGFAQVLRRPIEITALTGQVKFDAIFGFTVTDEICTQSEQETAFVRKRFLWAVLGETGEI
jgi:hypothetical protein